MIDEDIIARIYRWNEERYPMVHDITLTRALLVEEALELVDAHGDTVEVLDALGDLAFVAIGAMWKAGYSITRAKESLDTEQPAMMFSELSTAVAEDMPRLITRVHNILLQDGFNLSEVLRIICASNETKAVVKTDPSQKANVDKGAGFVPPTEALRKLVSLEGIL